MKKIYFLILLSFLFLGKTYSQNYFPKGATWHYDKPGIVSQLFNLVECKGDSIFNNDTLKLISGMGGCNPFNEILVKQIGQKIYKLNLCDSTFSLLYDFGANVGDTIVTYPDVCMGNDSVVLYVDSINPININGNLRKQFFTQQQYPFLWDFYNGYTIIEGIGSTYYLMPQYGLCAPYNGPLRCYNDTIIGEYNAGLHNGVCDTTYFYIGLNEETDIHNTIKLFPNPSNDIVNITSDLKIGKITLFDIRGAKLLSTKEKMIDLTSLPKGVYLLRIEVENNFLYRKVIRQ